MSTQARVLTAEDLWHLPRGKERHELVKGELHTMPPAGFEHGAIGNTLAFSLTHHVRANRLGMVLGADTGYMLNTNPDTVRAPDVSFVRQERIPSTGLPVRFWPGAPDLAVEVISPSDTVYEIDEKVQDYLEAGTALVWVVNPRRRTVTVHRPGENPVILAEKDTLDGGTVVPGFAVRVGDLFDN